MRNMILSYVDEAFNCEDIGINYVISSALSRLGIAAPLFVEPTHRIGDFGKMGKRGLHLRSHHTQSRSMCTRFMDGLYRNIFNKHLAAQKQFIASSDVFGIGGSGEPMGTVILSPYQGHRIRAHEDCFFIEKGGICSWNVP